MKKVLCVLTLLILSTFGYSLELGIQGMPSLNIYSDTVSINFDFGVGLNIVELPFSLLNIPNDTIKVNTEVFFNFFSTEDRRYYNVGLKVLPSYNAKVFEINKVNIIVAKLSLGVGVGYQGISQNVMNINLDKGTLLLNFEGRLDGLYRLINRFYVGISFGYNVLLDPSGEVSLAYSPKIGIPVIYEF